MPPGAEVILPALTWISCAHAVVLAGCTPVFCDVDIETQNVTAETIAPHLTDKTGAIMVVHYGGKPVRMAPILDLGLPVIEDAAHAVDSKLGGRCCGSIGAIGVYSFDAIKNLAMPEGGGLTAQNPDWIARARVLRYCGIGKSGFEASVTKDRWWEYNIAEFFPKFLPNDINGVDRPRPTAQAGLPTRRFASRCGRRTSANLPNWVGCVAPRIRRRTSSIRTLPISSAFRPAGGMRSPSTCTRRESIRRCATTRCT